MGELGNVNHKPKEIHVLVTGAGPWGPNTRNPANIIASALSTQLTESVSPDWDVKIHAAPTPWKVSYSWVRENIPPMLFPPAPEVEDSSVDESNGRRSGFTKIKPNYDIILFIGMAGGRRYYTLETQAHRDGYKAPDVDCATPSDLEFWTKAGAPETIPTSFDTDRLYRLWRENVPSEIDVRPSNDPGHYLCDFIYYTGLFEYWRQSGKDMKGTRPCMFLHVPGETTEEDITRGVATAEGLIRALAKCWIEGRK